MAKKSVRKNINDLDSTVSYLYSTGVFHSVIFHTIVLLFLALTFYSEPIEKHIKLSLSFQNVSETSISLDPIAPVEQLADDSSAQDSASSESEFLESFPEKEKSPEDPVQVEDIALDMPQNISDSNNDILELTTQDLEKVLVKEKATVEPISTRNNRNNSSNAIFSTNTSNNDGNNNGSSDSVSTSVMQGRLAGAGAKTGDVQISIGWNTSDDIDLHVNIMQPTGYRSYVSWISRVGLCGGMLDVDMNANPFNSVINPVENIFWGIGRAPHGEYVVSLHSFRSYSPSTNVVLMIKVDGKISTHNIVVKFGRPVTEVMRFKR